MTAVTIHRENTRKGRPRFRAVAGESESLGRTMGEALDALTAEWGDNVRETAVLIRRFGPDAHFTQAQYDRMQSLLSRRESLTPGERSELESLIDAELDATIARTERLVHGSEP